jgi:hypothetical protein
VSFPENELLLVGSAWVSIGIEHYTVDSPNVEHFRAASFILCKKVVVFDRKVQNVGGSLSGSRAVSFVERFIILIWESSIQRFYSIEAMRRNI